MCFSCLFHYIKPSFTSGIPYIAQILLALYVAKALVAVLQVTPTRALSD